jgi:hypothetical protein
VVAPLDAFGHATIVPIFGFEKALRLNSLRIEFGAGSAEGNFCRALTNRQATRTRLALGFDEDGFE